METRTVLYLNNASIMLLSLGCHSEAIQALHDAANLVKRLSSSDLDSDVPFLMEISDKLEKVSRRLCSTPETTSGSRNLTVRVVCESEPSWETIPSMSEEGTLEPRAILMIRLETVEDLRIIASAVIYNLASAHRYISALADTTHDLIEIHRSTYRMLHVSYSALMSHDQDFDYDRLYSLNESIILALLLLQQLVELSMLLGNPEYERIYASRLTIVNDYILNFHQMRSTLATVISAPAA